MAPAPALGDAYRRYKEGTERFVQWLAAAARSTGAVNDVFSSGPLPQKTTSGGRLKGKARKEAKEAGMLVKTSLFEVPIKAFARFAKAIANDPRIEVPRLVLGTLRAVIRGRKECAKWYLLNQEGTNPALSKNNDSHQHFIGVLETTLKTLETKTSRTAQATTAPRSCNTTKPPDAIGTANVFETLHIEESEQLEDIPHFGGGVKTPTKLEYKMETSDIDVSFALYCFLIDLTRVRLFVRRTWREFKEGATSLSAAALTMNAAIGLIEKLSNDFQEAYPQFADTDTQYMHMSLAEFVYTGYCSRQGSHVLNDVKDDDANPLIFKEGGQTLACDTVLCIHTADLIQKHFGSEELRLSYDERRFLKSMSQLSAIPIGMEIKGQPFKGDLVHKAIRSMVYNNRFETWCVLAVQMFWDTQRELGPMLPIASQLLENTALDLLEGYDFYFATEGLDTIGRFHKEFRAEMQSLPEQIKSTALSSGLQPFVDEIEQNSPWKFDIPGFSLLQYHPSLCGLTLLNIRDTYQRAAINMASSQGQVLVAAHLYNAAHQSGLADRWPDMEHFIEKQGSEWVFVGKRPEHVHETLVRLKLAKGTSIAKYAKDYKRSKSLSGKRFDSHLGKIRCFEYLARYSELSTIRTDRRYKKPSKEVSRARKDVTILADVLAKDLLGVKETNAPLSPLDTLSALKKAVEKDEHAFNFDAMSFYLRCLELLRGIWIHCMSQAPLDFPETDFRGSLGMNDVIMEMLGHCAGLPHYQRSMYPDASKILNDVIAKEGSMELDKAKERQEKVRLKQTTQDNQTEPSFENPDEDFFSLESRDLFGMIIIQDENGDCRMPFGLR